MKKYIYIAFAALCALTLASCDNFLDYTSQGSIAQDNFFLSDEQANGAIENCYYGLFERDGMFSREIYWEQACANDMVWGKTRGFPSLATLSYTGNESCILDTWNRIYNRYGIPKANWVVNSLLTKQAKEGLTPVETRVLGEGYFLRAQYHLLAPGSSVRATSSARSTICSPPTAMGPRNSVSRSWLTRMSRAVTTTPSPRSFLR